VLRIIVFVAVGLKNMLFNRLLSLLYILMCRRCNLFLFSVVNLSLSCMLLNTCSV
jgi:hypothetical protein